jgi:hypothetical protein
MTLTELAGGLNQANGPVLVMIGEALRMRDSQRGEADAAAEPLQSA